MTANIPSEANPELAEALVANQPNDELMSSLINPAEILFIAWDGVARNKIRSLLTMLGVIIGVAAVIIMIAI